MKTFTTTLAITLLGVAGMAHAQVNMPNPMSPGMSPQSAVRLDVTSELMVDRSIQRWLRRYYPGWDADPHEITEIGMDRFAVVRISANNQPSRKLYFRITRNITDEGRPPDFPTY